MTGAQADELEAQGARTRQLAGAAAVLAVLFAKAVTDAHPGVGQTVAGLTFSFVPHLFDLLGDGVVALGLGVVLAETPLFKDYLAKRLQQSSAFVVQARDPDFLRDFDAGFLGEVEAAIRRSKFGSDVPQEVDGFLRCLDRCSSKPTLWRTDYRVDIEWSDVPEKPGLRCLTFRVSWRYVNYASQETVHQQVIRGLVGDDPAEDYKVHSFRVDGVERLQEAKMSEVRGPNPQGYPRVYEGRVTIPVPVTRTPTDGVQVTVKDEFIERRDAPWLLTFDAPVHRLELVFRQHPPDIVPELYVFGLDESDTVTDPLVPVEAEATRHHWTYGGWFLPKHGLLLAVERRHAQPESPAQPEAPAVASR